jgi:hypothetical protein
MALLPRVDVKMKLSYVVVKISLSKAWELGSQEAWE